MKPWICSPVKTPKAPWACATADYLTFTWLWQCHVLLTMMRAQIALECVWSVLSSTMVLSRQVIQPVPAVRLGTYLFE